ncbi:auxin-responsive protein IAA26-like [Cucurbita pepo subsp. pepo]|uniref:auxin-responsive protein IAA26-like n=1 Tax=Cucurbita pepo subsp. pepo TaxID=3664 RepID=UPI000C9D40DC|nr:auxin-responsive protein IAA26-like [Cucurbita pepo subsp. pepo]XP_023524901.1 auxin-responsive protein IAA26-like [Cucurbita pepo subsp. pepo]XP_023524902.1 auxin-responsive protein IAA26-like [Cucurbita pepo subsp. pepo]
MEMNGCSEKDEDCPQLLDLIPKHRQWLSAVDVTGKTQTSDDKKLELTLGLPGDADWSRKERNDSLLSFGHFPTSSKFSPSENPWPSSANFLGKLQPNKFSGFCSKMGDLQNAEAKSFPSSANTPVSNTSQKRTAPAPVVGWPPIRSSRRNLRSSSFEKPAVESSDAAPSKLPAPREKRVEAGGKGLFVKINMDGVPIGRKIDLNAYDNYQRLSSAVDELFRALLAAQRDSSGSGVLKKQEEEKPITGLLDGSGEYTLVYEDNEGDRVLVGDVPWQMFISTVKRLRVLKSSELPALSVVGSRPQKRS